jgi:hypothetical protein
MKKKLLLGTLTLALAGAGYAHYYIWEKQTTQIASSLEKYLTDINSNSEIKLSHSGKKLSGCPAKSVVTFENPIIEIQAPNEGTIKADSLIISSNLLGDSLNANLKGDIVFNDNSDNFVISSQNGFECKVKADLSIVDIINGKTSAKTQEDLISKLRHFGCNSEKIALKSEDKLTASADSYGFNINLSKASQDETMLDFGLQVKDLEILDTTKIVDYPNAGKQNISINGGALIGAMGQKIDFEIRDFKISNDLYNFDLPIKIKNDKTFAISHNGFFTFNKGFTASAEMLGKQLANSYKVENEDSGQNADLEKLFIAAIPNVVEYSPIKSFINLTADQSTMSAKIEKIGFETSQFALNASGDAGMGAVDVLVTCQNCDILIEKTTSYVNNLAAFFNATGNLQTETFFSESTVTSLKEIAKECDSIPNDDLTTWKITQKDGEIYITDKKFSEIMVRLDEEIGSKLPQ